LCHKRCQGLGGGIEAAAAPEVIFSQDVAEVVVGIGEGDGQVEALVEPHAGTFAVWRFWGQLRLSAVAEAVEEPVKQVVDALPATPTAPTAATAVGHQVKAALPMAAGQGVVCAERDLRNGFVQEATSELGSVPVVPAPPEEVVNFEQGGEEPAGVELPLQGGIELALLLVGFMGIEAIAKVTEPLLQRCGSAGVSVHIELRVKIWGGFAPVSLGRGCRGHLHRDRGRR